MRRTNVTAVMTKKNVKKKENPPKNKNSTHIDYKAQHTVNIYRDLKE